MTGKKNSKNRGRSASPLANKTNNNQPNKKPNLTQTDDIAPTPSGSTNFPPHADMDVDTTPLDKGKNNEDEATSKKFDVDEAFDASENFLDQNKKSVQAFDRPKTYYHAYFPLDDLPGKSSQQKISFVVDLLFDAYDSFTGAVTSKHPENQLQQIIKISFRNNEQRDHACTVNLPDMENRTFLPLVITPQNPFIPEHSIKVTEIPLDATTNRVRTVFSKYGKIVRFSMETKNLWQQATITFASDTNFSKIKKLYRTFILNDMVRFHMCDLMKKDILERSKFAAKLASLPRHTTGKQLIEIARMIDATAWVIPKARSNYCNLQHAFFYFRSDDDVEAAISNDHLTIDGKHVTWTSTSAKLCAICSSPHHKVNDCPKKRKNPSDRNIQQLYQRFQPAQYDNYKAPPKKLKGAVRPNISFADVTNGNSQKETSKKPSSTVPKKFSSDTRSHNPAKNTSLDTPIGSWSDDIPDELNDALSRNDFGPISPTRLDNGTKSGGSMHENNTNDIKEFVRQQFVNFESNFISMMKTLSFTVKRVEAMEASLNIKVITPIEADCLNDDPERMEFDEVEPSINTSSSIIAQQSKTIDGLKSINQMHQNRLKSFTTVVNTLVKSCATFQSILIAKDLLPKDCANNLFPLGDAFDSDVDSFLNELPTF